jgi:predicted nucleic acid-binding protein
MSGSRILVDTNIVLYFLKGNREIEQFFSDFDVFISFITELELHSLVSLSPDAEHIINEFLSLVSIVDINTQIKSHTIQVRKRSKLKLPDAIIAATAFALNIPVLTADKAFSKINDSRVILFEF